MSLETIRPPVPPQSRKDYASDQEVRWCPGCGDYSILAQMQKVLPELGIPRENFVFISGIGCSSRFPYYMDTYGIHSIHGRAPTLASGLKIARPDLHVFIISGDGDGFSIGGNHMLHILRRNINATILLFNNRIYALTKGQLSPTSLQGAKTKSSPMGAVETPLNPMALALAAGASFVARSVDTEIKHLAETMRLAALHKGISFIEILQNCHIFNDGAWGHVKESSTKKKNTLVLEHGKPMVFGQNDEKGIRFNPQTLKAEVVDLGDQFTVNDLMVHDQSRDDTMLSSLLANMTFPEFPVPIGVFREVEQDVYEDGILAQVEAARELNGKGDLRRLLCSSDLWSVSQDGSENHSLTRRSPELAQEMLKGWEGSYSPLMLSALRKKVGELTLDKLPQVAAGASFKEALQVMLEHGCPGCVVVDEQGRYASTLTSGDLLRVATLITDSASVTVEQVATCYNGSINSLASLNEAFHQMAISGLSALAVVDQDFKPSGWLTVARAEAALG